MNWNIIDILLILLVLLSVVSGWQRGFIHGALDLVRWIGSLLIGLRFYQYVAEFLGSLFDLPGMWLLPLSFLVTALLASWLIRSLAGVLLRRLDQDVHTRPLNRALGIAPGLVSGLILAAIAATLLLSFPLPEGMRNAARNSALANRLTTATSDIESALAPVLDPIDRTLNRLTVRPESEKFIKLRDSVTDGRPRPDLEAEMLKLVNEERAAEGLPPLQADTAMRRVARMHSIDMFARGYFSHYTPEGHDLMHRIRRERLPFRTAGENLALAPTLTLAHHGLMRSPGHRANILQPMFGRVGIGIIDGGAHGLMVTQNFRN